MTRGFTEARIQAMARLTFCACPDPHPPLKDLDLRKGRCSTCGNLRRSTTSTRPASRWTRWAIIGAIALVVPGMIGALNFVAKTRRFRSALDEYAERTPEILSATEDEPRVRTRIRDLYSAIQNRLGGAFSSCFALRRALAEIESRGGDATIRRRVEEEDIQGDLSLGLGKLCLELEQKQWKGIIRQDVHLLPAKGEAEVTCLVKLKDPRSYAHLKYWLIKEDGRWGIYDFEDLDNRVRMSSTLGRFSKVADPVGLSLRVDEAKELFLKGLAENEAGRPGEALVQMQSAYTMARGTLLEAVTGRLTGDLLARLGRTEEALQVFDQLLKLKKGLPGALIGKGMVLDRLGNKAEALAVFEEAITVVGSDPVILGNIGRLKDETGKPADATVAYSQAAGLVGEDPDLAIELGYLLLRRGSREAAGPLLLAAARAGEDYFLRAAAQLQDARAVAEMDQLLASNAEGVFAPGEMPLLQGALLRWKGRAETAEPLLRQGMLKAPPANMLFFMKELSLVLSELNRIDEALKLAQQVATGEHWSSQGHFLKACALAGSRRDEAIEELRTALRENQALFLAADNETLLAPLRKDPGIRKLLEDLRPRVGLK
jgi:tetratricopeptide (TPR) repeat protein